VVAEKLKANADRDPRTTAALESERLTVLRIWEHEPVAETVDRIAEAVTARR
jgi:G:T-mismatch repair DNA endonuclease (very short patch repair protein)